MIPLFTCPSIGPVSRLFDNSYARGNYAGNNGIGPMAEVDTGARREK